jgi:hypothetical protein
MRPALVEDVFASVPRVVGEEPDFQEGSCDECGRFEGSYLSGVRWRLSCEGAIAFRLWKATLYPVEITGGQNFGERQPALRHIPPLSFSRNHTHFCAEREEQVRQSLRGVIFAGSVIRKTAGSC